MRQLIHFVGMRRSGNHALVRWLQKNAFSESEEGTVIHLNDVYAPYAQPSRELRPHDVDIVSSNKNLVLILSYEDLPLELVSSLPTIIGQDAILSNSIKRKFLLLRDPYNAFASRLQRLSTAEKEGFSIAMQRKSWPSVIELWKSYAREYLGKTSILDGTTPINYNEWVVNKNYRDAFLQKHFCRRENFDIGIDEVSTHGGGSSFDRLTYSGRAAKMDTNSRWQYFLENTFYRDLFADRELQYLSQEIFGHISGTEILYDRFHGIEGK